MLCDEANETSNMCCLPAKNGSGSVEPGGDSGWAPFGGCQRDGARKRGVYLLFHEVLATRFGTRGFFAIAPKEVRGIDSLGPGIGVPGGIKSVFERSDGGDEVLNV